MVIDYLCTVIAFLLNIALAVMLFYKSQKEREKVFFACYALYYAAGSLIYLLKRDHVLTCHGDPFSFEVLSYGSFLIVIFLYFPLEVMFPNLKKGWMYASFLIFPFLFSTFWKVLLKNGMNPVYLSDISEIPANLNDASLVLRLYYFFFILLFFAGSVIFMIWGHNRYMTSRIVRVYAYGAIPIMIIYIPIVLYGLDGNWHALHICYMIFYNTVIAYLLLKPEKLPPQPEMECDKYNDGLTIEEQALLQRLDNLIEMDKLYCRSDLTLPELSQLLGTNRTKLSKLIRCKGFNTFQDYLNSYRLEEFKQIILSGKADKINEAAQMAGFGSKATVYRCFMSTYGVSPSQYMKSKLP